MVLFVGEESKGFFVGEVVKELGETVSFTGYAAHISDVKEKMIAQDYSHIIINCEPLIDDFKVIATELAAIQTTTDANIIIMAVGFSVRSELIQSLAGKGFRNFVLDGILARQKTQLLNAINCVDSVLDDVVVPSPVADAPEGEAVAYEQTIKKEYKTIAFAGCCSRMGATTHAIQFIKYLNYLGYSACYIEMNSTGFVRTLSQVFEDVELDTKTDKVRYMGIDFYDKKENIAHILKLPYDYFVYDCGNFEDSTFNLIPFLEKDISVCVCGSKANELKSTNSLIQKTYKSDVIYLFNFCHQSEQKDILDLMDEKAESTAFAGYAPDPFTYISKSNNIYSQILNLKSNTSNKKRKGLLGRGKKE